MASPRADSGSMQRVGGALPRFSWGTSIAVLVVVGAAGWSVRGTEFDLIALFSGGGAMERFVSEMFPPDFSARTLASTWTGILQTLQMSFLGALIGAFIALPLAALGTRAGESAGLSRRERTLRAVPYNAARFVLNIFRSVPDILWALVFVVALGLGPFPGTLALAVHSAGVLGKLYSETLEAVPSRPAEALASSGAGEFQTFLFARLPQAAAGFASLSLYQWECNIRSATILGFVGAGGIGQEILIAMNLFDYPRVATLVGATIIVVLIVDRLSAVIRARLVS